MRESSDKAQVLHVLPCSVFTLSAHTVPVREWMLVLYNDIVTAFVCSAGDNVTVSREHFIPAECRGRHSITLLGLEPGTFCRCKRITLHSRRTIVNRRVM